MKLKKNKLVYSPTDLAGHLNCKHLTQLNKQLAKGEINEPEAYNNQVLAMLAEKGNEFEQGYLELLKSKGYTISIISTDASDAEKETITSMEKGVDIIYQARLKEDGKWSGWADFLKKVPKPSELGPWSYEVWDTKLANETKAATILQIGLYSEKVSEIQGVNPVFMGVIKPSGEERFRFDEYAAYIRLAKRNLENSLENDEETYPEPVDHCNICKWWKNCNKVRRGDDHLTFVAGSGNSQIKELKQQNINTLEELANTVFPIPFVPNKGSKETFNKLREQARIQYESRENDYEPIYEILNLEEARGLYKLPKPTENDIYLDFEGDRMVEPDGLEYMIGYVYQNKYSAFWAKNETEEKEIFERFVRFAFDLKQKNPSLHIYHYAPYEVTALKRLMGKYAVCENEIDYLLRSGTFIDFYQIVRQSVRASVEKYSIKDLEIFFGYEREMDLRELSKYKAQLELLLQTGNFEDIPNKTKEAVQLYNQDDCKSLVKLQDWLEEIRYNLIQKGENIPRPELTSGEASENITAHQERIQPLIDNLLLNIPTLKSERNKVQQAKFILAHMLDWYRREKKSFWWEFFRLKELSIDELFDERKAISGLSYTGNREPIKRSFLDSYTFPSQECDLRKGHTIEDQEGNKIGTIHDINLDTNRLLIKKGPSIINIPHPKSVISLESINSKTKEDAIIRMAEWVVSNSMESDDLPYKAARELLLNEVPDVNEPLTNEDDLLKHTQNFVEKLNNSYLPLQGPPGSGKSFTGSHVIVDLIKKGKIIGVTALSHKVITNLLQKVWDTAQKQNQVIKIVQKVKTDFEEDLPWNTTTNENNIQNSFNDFNVVAGTSFMWSKEGYENSVDYLFVDEAGQLSLIDVLAVSHCCKNIILLGDPQQLKQPQQGVHPEGTDVSALEHVLQGEKTISDEQGVFLSKTWRMHPSINAFVSELFYQNRLQSKPNLINQKILGSKYSGSGLFLEEVEHFGNTNSSPEEVEKVVDIVNDLILNNEYVDENGETHVLTKNDIKIITPYNSQVQAIKKVLPNMEVGTVDKFQGQEAQVIIYSVATSSLEDAPRGMDFLFSPNRFNVAVSRARTCFIMVANPNIFEVECKSPYQIKLANAFCRFKEMKN